MEAIETIIAQGESETLEFKPSFNQDVIEYGSGIKRVIDACLDAGLPEPEFENFSGGFQIVFTPTAQVAAEETAQVKPHDEEVTPHVEVLIGAIQGELSRTDMMKIIGLKDRMHFSREYLQPALDAGVIEMTLPDKPKSTKQKYRLTEKGKQFLKDGE